MGNAYEIYALRYATMSPRTPQMNFLQPDPHDTAAADLDYFVWLVRGHRRDILVDTGFNAQESPRAPPQAAAHPGRGAGTFGRKGRRYQGRHRYAPALRPCRQSRPLPRR